jgi:hypothetical protein
MPQNVKPSEALPRVVIAIAAGTAAAWAPKVSLKALLLGVAGGMLATVATGYCPVNTLTRRRTVERPTWRTLRSWRVEPPLAPPKSLHPW